MTETELEADIHATIPLTRAMQLRVLAFDGNSLRLYAPLAPNVNDKGCAFGGSLASVLTLAAWGLARMALQRAGLVADVYVQDSTIEYLAPVWSDFDALASVVGEDSLEAFVARFAERGKARLSIVAVANDGGAPATRLTGRFVALRKA